MLQHDFGNRLTALPLEATTPFLRLSRLLLSRSGVSVDLLQHCQPQQVQLCALWENNRLKINHNKDHIQNPNVLLVINVSVIDCHNKPFLFSRWSNWVWCYQGCLRRWLHFNIQWKELIINTSENMKVTITVKGPSREYLQLEVQAGDPSGLFVSCAFKTLKPCDPCPQ